MSHNNENSAPLGVNAEEKEPLGVWCYDGEKMEYINYLKPSECNSWYRYFEGITLSGRPYCTDRGISYGSTEREAYEKYEEARKAAYMVWNVEQSQPKERFRGPLISVATLAIIVIAALVLL